MPLSSPHRHFSECASTNDIARAWAADTDNPAPHGALVTADFQTRGRGRRGRQWQAARGESVLMSAVVRPALAPSDTWQLAFVAALAVSDALSAYVPHLALKWPNDVLAGGNKAAGVLVETVQLPERGWVAIVGIGVNVGQTQFDPAVAYAAPPTSLLMAGGEAPPVPALVQQIAQALEARLAQLTQTGWAAVRADWQARMAQDVVLQRGAERGLLVDLEADGQARVRLPGGTFARWATVDPEEGANLAPDQV